MVVVKGKTSNETTKLAETLFEEFCNANNPVDILLTFHKLKAAIGVENPESCRELYEALKSKLQSWKCQSLWTVLDARAKHKEYGNQKICEDLQVLVIGCGPIGLRTAIEVALLGAKVIIVEKRTSFSRNNVLHLWPFLIHDFRSLGAKRFYGKFCSGSLDHIGIRMLQCMLMKTALILGVQIYTGVTFEEVIEPTSECGWRCQMSPPFHPASQVDVDMVVGADGKKNVLPGFPQIEMRGSLAIGITLNLVYHGTKQEAAIPEISGLAYHFKPQFFDELFRKSGVRLENFVYYKGETHYFVMTAVKSSLLARGALLMDYPKAVDLLSPHNVNRQKLMDYALDAVTFGTDGKLTDIEFAVNDRGKADIAVFDFTSLKKSEHAAKIVERKGHRLLMALVGDSLIEPFWPTGSGCARGVLSALDTAWMLRSFAMDRPPLQVLSERENVYKLLSATTTDNIRKKFENYTINPITRYADRNMRRVKEVYHLYDTDDPVSADFRLPGASTVTTIIENTKRRISTSKPNKNRRKSSSDDLLQKKERRRLRKSSSEDLDETKKGIGKKQKKKNALSRSNSRDTDSELNVASKSKNKTKKLRSQSSESADEKETRRRQRKLGRVKSRDTDSSTNSLEKLNEDRKTPGSDRKGNRENKNNSVLMKQRSTKRWKLFGGTKPKPSSFDKHMKSDSEEIVTKSESKKKVDPLLSTEKFSQGSKDETKISSAFQDNVSRLRNGSTSAPSDRKNNVGLAPIVERYSRSSQSGLAETPKSSPTQIRNSLRKTNELRAPHDTGFTRSMSNSAVPAARIQRGTVDKPRSERVFTPGAEKMEYKMDVGIGETGEEKHSKRLKLDSIPERVTLSDDVKSLSPAAQRTAPLLKTLTPDRKRLKFDHGGAVTAAAGIAAMLALTTPLAIDGEHKRKEMERQKILASSQVSVREKIALLNSGNSTNKKTRRDLTKELNSVDGVKDPVRRYFSFSTARKNLKKNVDDHSQKTNTLPRQIFSRRTLQEKMFSEYADIPSALDSAINILIKSYKFNDLQATLKTMLNVFRCISKDPDKETPRRIWTGGQLFHSLVWNVNEAKLFMVVSGWMEIGSFIVFPKTKTTHEPIRILMQNYRQLWETQNLETANPQMVFPSDNVVKRRRLSDDVFHENDEFLKDDQGSNSGSDSGMGFSETASEQNVNAVLPVDDDIGVIANDMTTKRASQTLDPKMYLEASYVQPDPSQSLNPHHYLNQSIAVESEQSIDIVQSSKPESLRPRQSLSSNKHHNPPLKSTDHPRENMSSSDNLNGNLRKHYWEILDEPTGIHEEPEGVLYSPLHQSQETAKNSDMNCDPRIPLHESALPRHDSIVSTNDSSMKQRSVDDVKVRPESRQRGQSKQRYQLDALFEALDFVNEVLDPPQVIYNNEPIDNENKTKKSRVVTRSNEASRRREEYTRSKIKQKSTEENSEVKSQRKTRNRAAKEKQLTGGTSVDKNGLGSTRGDDNRRNATRRQKNQDVDRRFNDKSIPEFHNETTDERRRKPLRRSQRIAESSNRKAVLVLDASGFPNESSTDLNQAFVDSNVGESQQDDSGNNSITHRRRKVRRQSSMVKTNKSRARTKRNGHKLRKDLSLEA